MTGILSPSKRVFNASNSNAIITKSKNIFWTLFCISKSYIKFEEFCKKRWTSEVIFSWNYRLPKARLLKWRKSPVWEHVWTVNMLKYPKDRLNLHSSIFLTFLISLKGNHPKKFCYSSIWNLETVCYLIDTRWQVFSLSKSGCLT